MVKDMMDAWMPQKRDLGPRNGNWSLTRKTNFSPKLAEFFSFFRKLLKQCERHSGQRLLMVSALESL